MKEIWGTLEKEKPTYPFMLGHWTKTKEIILGKKTQFLCQEKKKEKIFFWLNHMTFIFTHQIYKIKK